MKAQLFFIQVFLFNGFPFGGGDDALGYFTCRIGYIFILFFYGYFRKKTKILLMFLNAVKCRNQASETRRETRRIFL
jgi:hypothetical protein